MRREFECKSQASKRIALHSGKINLHALSSGHGWITRQVSPPGNQNAFRHGLAAVHNRRAEGQLTENERDIRAKILAGLITEAKCFETKQIFTDKARSRSVRTQARQGLGGLSRIDAALVRVLESGLRQSCLAGYARRKHYSCSLYHAATQQPARGRSERRFGTVFWRYKTIWG